MGSKSRRNKSSAITYVSWCDCQARIILEVHITILSSPEEINEISTWRRACQSTSGKVDIVCSIRFEFNKRSCEILPVLGRDIASRNSICREICERVFSRLWSYSCEYKVCSHLMVAIDTWIVIIKSDIFSSSSIVRCVIRC